MQLLRPVIFHSLISISLAVLVNVTVDDTLGDPKTGTFITYLPENQWNNGSACTTCAANSHLDLKMIYNGTWHNGTANNFPGVNPTQLLASIPFFGSAVYVYCIIANTMQAPEYVPMKRASISPHDIHSTSGYTEMTFLIDDQLAGTFSKQPTLTGDNSFQYNALVYANQSLPQDNHTLTIQNGHIGGEKSLVLLDYIVYTYENGLNASVTSATVTRSISGPMSSSTALPSDNKESLKVNSSGKIVGGILGSISIILLAFVAFLWRRQQISNGSMYSKSPSYRPDTTPANSIHWIQSWWKSPGSATGSRFSFNPNLLVQPKMKNLKQASSVPHFRRPPPITTVAPLHLPPQRPDSTRPLQPNREVTPTPSLDPHNERSLPLSIVEWQRRTQREADDAAPRFDVPDVDLSSYYEFSSDTAEPPPQPRRLMPRRFTVVNV